MGAASKPPIELRPTGERVTTINEDIRDMRDVTGSHRIDEGALADAVATILADKTGSKNKSSLVTIVGTVLALVSAAGAGNFAVMSSGDDETQAIVRTELQSYGDKMEAKVKIERDMLRMEMKRDREEVHTKIEGIEKSTQQTAIDIAVIKSRLEK
jgi:hypothetical protein